MRSLTSFPVQSEESQRLLTDSTSSAADRYYERSSRLWSVTYVCIVAVQAIFVLGFALGITSPVLSELGDEKSGYNSLHKTTYKDIFSGTILVGATIVTPFGGYLVDYLGRKLSIILCCIPYTIGWLLILLSAAFDSPAVRPLLFTGRFVLGIAAGWSSVSVGLYPAEMSTRYTRGAFVVMNQLALTVGTFIAQLVGNYIAYYWLAVISLALTLVFTLTATTIKETPRWLMTQNRKEEARKVLTWLRGPNYDVEQELQDVEDRVMSEEKLTLVQTLREFKYRSVYYPVFLASVIMFFRQFSGIVAVLFNAEDIFKQAEVKSPGLTSSLSTGGVQIIASLVGVFIADLFGRRMLMIGSSIIMCLAHGTMGTYEFLNNKPYCNPPDDPKCKDHLYPLAIVSVAIFVACYSAGLSAASRLVMPEIIPLRVRGVGVGIALFVSWGSSIIIGGLFDNYQEAVKPWGAYWTFSLICLIGALFVAIFIPETKGKSLEDIEHIFMGKRRSRKLNLQ